MSGGSWDYLCYISPSELENRMDDIKKMGERLIKEDYPSVGKRFLAFVEKMELWKSEKEVFMETYEGVMRAVEWYDSGDWGHDKLIGAIQELLTPLQPKGE